jgi:hypothetical protein
MLKQFFRLIIFTSAWLALVTVANAGIYVDKVEHPKKVVIFKIQGNISHTDVSAFQNALNQIKNDGYKIKLNSVVLDSNGGSGTAAVAIGKIIRKEKFNTYVGPKHSCHSACVFILSSGIIRMAYGEVSVHRGTLYEDYPIENLEESLKTLDTEILNHLFEMGMSSQLIDAIRVTPFWTVWTLNEKEKRRWGVHGTERYYEELWFRTTATAKQFEISNIKYFFYKHFDKCTKQAKEFKMTVFDCVKNEM